MNLCVIGTGYVGAVTGACFADLGNQVIGVDVDAVKVALLRKGELPIFEPGLQEMVRRNLRKGRLKFTTSLKEGVQRSEIIFISVGTPQAPSGDADLGYVKEAARGVGRHINGPKIIVNKSTVPVGMGDMVESLVAEEMEKRGVDYPVEVVSCPEFLREGSALWDFQNPDRVVIGSKSREAADRVAELFKPLKARLLVTDLRSAEMIKYASNAFLAVKISFINEIANLCERVGSDVSRVAEGMGLDKRVGAPFLNAGAGYGGSCFPKDVSALVRLAERKGYDFQILKSVIQVNQRQKKGMVSRIERVVGPLEGRQVGLLGLAFKANTDDMREAVSLDVVTGLQDSGARVRAYDPAAMGAAKKLMPQVKLCRDAYEAARGAACLVVLTEWDEFKELDLVRIKKELKNPVMVDGRNLYDPAKMRRLGFQYHCVGRNGA
jgi:UDPglucose 6-dehydrogenase